MSQFFSIFLDFNLFFIDRDGISDLARTLSETNKDLVFTRYIHKV